MYTYKKHKPLHRYIDTDSLIFVVGKYLNKPEIIWRINGIYENYSVCFHWWSAALEKWTSDRRKNERRMETPSGWGWKGGESVNFYIFVRFDSRLYIRYICCSSQWCLATFDVVHQIGTFDFSAKIGERPFLFLFVVDEDNLFNKKDFCTIYRVQIIWIFAKYGRLSLLYWKK